MANHNGNKVPIYLSTGIDALNEILAMDNVDATMGGFLIRDKEEGKEFETPIILIDGETGTGKTTLILQIAFSAAAQNRWLPCFFALEQTVRSVEKMADSFGYFQEVGIKNDVSFCDLEDPQEIESSRTTHKIFMCHLAPRPISEGGSVNLFQTHLDQLSHMIEKLKQRGLEDTLPVFFIDSINAFSTETLSRNEIYRLFTLFKNNRVPAVLTMEYHWDYELGVESDCIQNAKFLSDIVISLRKESTNYLKYYLEIEKSRVSRQALGRHLYKIRTAEIAEKIHRDPRTGIVLYPSIHSVLSKAREHTLMEKADYFVNENDEDLQNIIKTETVELGECFSIIGPTGTHKLALGLNISLGYRKGQPPSLLLVNFGGAGDFNFRGVAWTTSRQYCRYLVPSTDETESQVKFWNAQYGCTTPSRLGQEIGDTQVTIINFRIGQLTPEECFYTVEKVIAESHENPYSSVLLSDTADLCNGFPLLASDPQFLQALIDLFATRNLVTVCIGVDAGQSAKNADINFSLSSRANYRIVLSHFPSVQELSKSIVYAPHSEMEDDKTSNVNLAEQLVTLVVDNVTGKHYGRELRWLSAETVNEQKFLRCKVDPFAKTQNGAS